MNPILIFPWHRPFLPELKSLLEARYDRDDAPLIIVPHNRPRRYLYQLYAADHKARLLPKVITLNDMIVHWRSTISPMLHTTSTLDRAFLLYGCVQQLAKEDSDLANYFLQMDLPSFLPWGLRLASLLEELFCQCVQPKDIAYAEMEAAPAGAALLGALGRIGPAYQKILETRSWTTPGLDALNIADSAHVIPNMFRPLRGRPVLIAGFHILSKAEDKILFSLWKAGALVCLHTDPALAKGSPCHWACSEHKTLLKRWKADTRLVPDSESYAPEHKPHFTFFAGYDCHSQLQTMREILDGTHNDQTLSTAVVLTTSSLLMPALHHLPCKDINISMGYPLIRSHLHHLLNSIFQLQIRRSDEGSYYWRDVLQVIRHPYLKHLAVYDAEGHRQSLHQIFYVLEKNIVRGSRYVDMDSLTEDHAETIDPTLRSLFHRYLDVIFLQLTTAQTTTDIADFLHDICEFLLRSGTEIWAHYPLDAEALYRLMRHVIPMLRTTLLAGHPLPFTDLYRITKEIMTQEYVPFEADPLTGLQVLGMLETRLLHFERVIILDATDDKLPGNPVQDPLMPDSLRMLLGLPDSKSREHTTAHTLYGLCAGATEVHFLWQEGINRSALFDGKKNRSRFIEELIWQEEQNRGELLRPGQGPLRNARCDISAFKPGERNIVRSPAIDKAVRFLLDRPLSASKLDLYLQCPLAFAWRHLCDLTSPQEVIEGDDPASVGICLHDTLRLLYEPWLNRTVRRGDISQKDIQLSFERAMDEADLRRLLPAASCLMLESAVPLRLDRFLLSQPASTTIIALEKELKSEIILGGKKYFFTGQVDRLDLRDGLLHVLDYKSGTIKKGDASLWQDHLFFQSITRNLDRIEEIDSLFCELCSRLPSLQLPCYIALLKAKGMTHIGDAALVDLRSSGKEFPLFGELCDEDLSNALAFNDMALTLVLRHLESSPVFNPRPDKHCHWCAYASICNA